jgi:hypothetical protein
MYARLQVLGDHVRTRVPRDHATAAGRQAISGARLAARSSDVADAAESLQHAVVSALRLDDPDPRAVELPALAEQLHQRATELADEHKLLTAANANA